MKQALLAALEPVLLSRARRLARELPAERRPRVSELARAAETRARTARDLWEPGSLPAALVLGREALALSASALLSSRGELEGDALPAPEALDALPARPSEGLCALMTSQNPDHADGLALDEQRRLAREIEAVLANVRSLYEARPPGRVTLAAALRLALGVACVAAVVGALIALASSS